jgi:VWFA-related protein
VPNPAQTKKWACAHWCASTIPKNYDTTVFIANYTPASAKRQTSAGYNPGIVEGLLRMHRPLSFILFFAFCCLLASAQKPGGGRPPSNPRPIEPGVNPITPPDVLGQTASTVSAENEAKVEFRSETVLVQVPVTATDKAGNHVHGLTKNDFHILENGKEQKIAAFEELTSTHTPVVVSGRPGTFTNQVADRDKRRAITIIALDTVNTPFLDQSFARRELVKYLAKNIDTGQTLALVAITSKGMRVLYGLTSSAQALQQVLQKVSGETEAMQSVDSETELAAFSGDQSNVFSGFTAATAETNIDQFIRLGDVDYAQFKQEAAIETTMQAFLGMAWSLSGIPGRKTLLWATGGFPFALDSPSTVPAGRLSLLYERAMQALNEADISVYPVDVQGLVYGEPGASSGRTQKVGGPIQPVVTRAWLRDAKKDTLRDFAEMTGGKAFYNTNDLAGAFQRATDDASSCYMLGYYLDTKNNRPGWRQLKVKLEKKDVEIRARRGFFVTNATMNPEATRTNDMTFAMAAPFQATGIPIEMQWGAVKEIPGNKEKKQVTFMLHVIGTDISVDGAQNALNLSVAAVATKPATKKESSTVAANFAEAIKGNLKPENIATLRAHGLTHPGALELGSGQYSVRFVVRDNISGRLGSLSVPVTVN